MEKSYGSECIYVCKNAERRYSAVILFAVHDDVIHSMGEPRLAASVDIARLSLGRFFIEHEDMKNRIDQTSLVTFGYWDPDDGICSSVSTEKFSASDCIDFYLQEVKKQNEGALQETVSSDSHGV